MTAEFLTALDKLERNVVHKIDSHSEKIGELSDRVMSLEQRGSANPDEAEARKREAESSRAKPVNKWIDSKTGAEIKVLGKADRFVDTVQPGAFGTDLLKAGISLGDFARALVVGPKHELLRKAMSEGTATAGGHLVPTPLAAYAIDRMRAQAVLLQAGAATVPLEAQTLKLARVTADPTVEWLAENASQTDSQPTFDSVTLSAKTLRCLVKASRELVEDAPNFDALFESALAQAFAAEVDRVGLVGSGSGAQPLGLFGTSGISSVSMGTNGAALTNYDPFVDALAALWGANVPQVTGMIYAPRTAGALAKLKATDNQPLQAPAEVAAVPRFITSGIPIDQVQGSASNASCVLAGNFNDLLIGVRHGFTLEAYPGPGAANFQIHFLAHLRVDFAVARPTAFARIIGIIP